MQARAAQQVRAHRCCCATPAVQGSPGPPQSAHDGRVSVRGGQQAVPLRIRREAGPPREQQFHHLQLARGSRAVQRRAAAAVQAVCIQVVLEQDACRLQRSDRSDEPDQSLQLDVH